MLIINVILKLMFKKNIMRFRKTRSSVSRHKLVSLQSTQINQRHKSGLELPSFI